MGLDSPPPQRSFKIHPAKFEKQCLGDINKEASLQKEESGKTDVFNASHKTLRVQVWFPSKPRAWMEAKQRPAAGPH